MTDVNVPVDPLRNAILPENVTASGVALGNVSEPFVGETVEVLAVTLSDLPLQPTVPKVSSSPLQKKNSKAGKSAPHNPKKSVVMDAAPLPANTSPTPVANGGLLPTPPGAVNGGSGVNLLTGVPPARDSPHLLPVVSKSSKNKKNKNGVPPPQPPPLPAVGGEGNGGGGPPPRPVPNAGQGAGGGGGPPPPNPPLLPLPGGDGGQGGGPPPPPPPPPGNGGGGGGGPPPPLPPFPPGPVPPPFPPISNKVWGDTVGSVCRNYTHKVYGLTPDELKEYSAEFGVNLRNNQGVRNPHVRSHLARDILFLNAVSLLARKGKVALVDYYGQGLRNKKLYDEIMAAVARRLPRDPTPPPPMYVHQRAYVPDDLSRTYGIDDPCIIKHQDFPTALTCKFNLLLSDVYMDGKDPVDVNCIMRKFVGIALLNDVVMIRHNFSFSTSLNLDTEHSYRVEDGQVVFYSDSEIGSSYPRHAICKEWSVPDCNPTIAWSIPAEKLDLILVLVTRNTDGVVRAERVGRTDVSRRPVGYRPVISDILPCEEYLGLKLPDSWIYRMVDVDVELFNTLVVAGGHHGGTYVDGTVESHYRKYRDLRHVRAWVNTHGIDAEKFLENTFFAAHFEIMRRAKSTSTLSSANLSKQETAFKAIGGGLMAFAALFLLRKGYLHVARWLGFAQRRVANMPSLLGIGNLLAAGNAPSPTVVQEQNVIPYSVLIDTMVFAPLREEYLKGLFAKWCVACGWNAELAQIYSGFSFGALENITTYNFNAPRILVMTMVHGLNTGSMRIRVLRHMFWNCFVMGAGIAGKPLFDPAAWNLSGTASAVGKMGAWRFLVALVGSLLFSWLHKRFVRPKSDCSKQITTLQPVPLPSLHEVHTVSSEHLITAIPFCQQANIPFKMELWNPMGLPTSDSNFGLVTSHSLPVLRDICDKQTVHPNQKDRYTYYFRRWSGHVAPGNSDINYIGAVQERILSTPIPIDPCWVNLPPIFVSFMVEPDPKDLIDPWLRHLTKNVAVVKLAIDRLKFDPDLFKMVKTVECFIKQDEVIFCKEDNGRIYLKPRLIQNVPAILQVVAGPTVYYAYKKFVSTYTPDTPLVMTCGDWTLKAVMSSGTPADLDRFGTIANQKQPPGVALLIVSGDDSVLRLFGDGWERTVEEDFSQFDQSQNNALCWLNRTYRYQGFSEDCLEALWRMCSLPLSITGVGDLHIKVIRANKQGPAPYEVSPRCRVMRATGGCDTTYGNGLVNIGAHTHVLSRLSTAFPPVAEDIVIAYEGTGLRVKAKVCEDFSSCTFLKGMWVQSQFGMVWMPLLSRLVKMPKASHNPTYFLTRKAKRKLSPEDAFSTGVRAFLVGVCLSWGCRPLNGPVHAYFSAIAEMATNLDWSSVDRTRLYTRFKYSVDVPPAPDMSVLLSQVVLPCENLYERYSSLYIDFPLLCKNIRALERHIPLLNKIAEYDYA